MDSAAIEVHTEDGVSMYSVVKVAAGGCCGICFQEAMQTAEIDVTEIHNTEGGGPYGRGASLFICEGCAYRIGGMFAASNADKELFNGQLQNTAH